jgi:superfamily II DNA/RNA helicase
MLLGGDYDVVGQAQTGTGKTAAFTSRLSLKGLLAKDERWLHAIWPKEK